MIGVLLIVLVHLLGEKNQGVPDEQMRNVLSQQMIDIVVSQLLIHLRIEDERNVVEFFPLRGQIRIYGIVSGLFDHEFVLAKRLQAPLLVRPAIHGGGDDAPSTIHISEEPSMRR